MRSSAWSPAVGLVVTNFSTVVARLLVLVHAAEVHGVGVPDVRGRDLEPFPQGGLDVAHNDFPD